MHRELFKLFIVLLLSMFMHIVIFQLRFATIPSSSSTYRSTEVALVEHPYQFNEPAERAGPAPLKAARNSAEGRIRNGLPGQRGNITPGVSGLVTSLVVEKAGEKPVVTNVNRAVTTGNREVAPPLPKSNNLSGGNEIAVEDSSVDLPAALKESLAAEGARPLAAKSEVAASTVMPSPVKADKPAGHVYEPVTTVQTVARLNLAVAEFLSTQDRTGLIERNVRSAVPRYDINPAPVYPDIALLKGWEGRVLLKVMVREDGSVDSVAIDKSSGFKALDRAALKAVRRWQFVPALSAGVPVAGGTKVPIRFDLP